MNYKLGIDINIDKVSWSILDKDNMLLDCGCFVTGLSPENRDNYFRGETIKSISIKHSVKKRRKLYNGYKNRRDRLIRKLVSIDFCNPSILEKKYPKNYIYNLRKKAQYQEVTREEFSLLCLHFNKNRGYYHNRIIDENSNLKKVIYKDTELEKSKETLSDFLLNKLNDGHHSDIEGDVFSRKKVKEDFDVICKVQSSFKRYLTPKILKDIRDRIIFHQKKFKFSNQKYNNCFFEKYHKTAHISNPYYQDFLLWKQLNSLIIYDKEGYEYILDINTKKKLFKIISNLEIISSKEILKELKRIGDIENETEWTLNIKEVKGNKLRYDLIKILKKEKLNKERLQKLIKLDYSSNNLNNQPFFDIWHSIYSISDEFGLQKKLQEKYNLKIETVENISNIRLNEKTQFSYLSTKACRKLIFKMEEGFMYSMACKDLGYKNFDKVNFSKSIKKQSPVHKFILDKVNILVEELKNKYDSISEINTVIDPYLSICKDMRKNRMDYILGIRGDIKKAGSTLKKEYKNSYISGLDNEKYRIWKENKGYDLLNLKEIDEKDLFSENYKIVGILGDINNGIYFLNKTLTHKNNILNKEDSFRKNVINDKEYLEYINNNIKSKLPLEKYLRYLGIDNKLDFERKSFFEERLKIKLKEVSTNINIVDNKYIVKLLNDLNFVDKLKEIDKYRNEGLEVSEKTIYKGNNITKLKKWRKIDDYRYFILKSVVANSKLDLDKNNINRIFNYLKEVIIYNNNEDSIISKKKNPIKQLHRDTIYAKSKKQIKVNLNTKITKENIDNVCSIQIKRILLDRVKEYSGDIKKSFQKKELTKNPIIYKKKNITSIYIWEKFFSTKKEINKYLHIDKIVDKGLKEALVKFTKGDIKKLDNKTKLKFNGTIPKSIRVEDSALDLQEIRKDSFVYLRDNHHISIFKNKEGKIFAEKITYWEVLQRLYKGDDIINVNSEEKKIIFSLKINDYFLFTDKEIDFNDNSIENKKYISDNLFRAQKLTVKSSGQVYFWFRHHKESSVNNHYSFTEKIISTINNMKGVYKVDIDILGKIINTKKLDY